MNHLSELLAITAFITATFFCVPSIARNDEPVFIPDTEINITIDARLDEAAWQTAAHFTLDYETNPGENIAAPVKTDVWVVHDSAFIYFALYCYDPDPDAIRARLADRDSIFADDLININLDTFNDERRNYFFGVNPLGLQRDGIETQDGGDPSWDAIWDSAGRIVDDGYIIEMALPFSCMQIQSVSGRQIWGLDVSRWYPRSVMHRVGLVPLDRNNNSYQGQFLKITGFEQVDPGRNIEVTPTVITSSTDARSELPAGELENISRDLEAGASIRWGITPNFTLNGTINPDFSQVEADARQLDINTRFALFFHEKRPFFMEGYDFFQTQINAVYTRTMRDPTVGIKLTGKDGENTYGVYAVQDDITNIIFPGSQSSSATSLLQESDIGVFRYKRDLGARTTLGALLTSRNSDDYHNHVYGLDAVVRFDDRNRFDLQYLGSNTAYPGFTAASFSQPTDDFSDDALYMRYQYQSRNISAYSTYKDFGKDFRSDLGFIPQVGYRELYSGAEYRWISNEGWWNQFQIRGEFLTSEEEKTGDLLQRISALTFTYNGTMQSQILLYGGNGTELYAGKEHDVTEYVILGGFQPTSDLQLNLWNQFGDAIDYANNRTGERLNSRLSLTYRLGRNTRINFDHNFERLSADDARLYTANISQGTVVYHINAKTFIRSILQYVNYDYNVANYSYEIEPEFRQLFSQFLFSYKLNPTTVLFLGYSDNYRGGREFGLTQTDRTFFMKIGYTLQY